MIEGYSIPKGWSTATLVDVCRIVMGQSPPSTTYNVNRQGLPFFQGKKEFGPIYPEPEVYCSSPGKIAEPGAILLSVRAPVGPTNIALERCCIGRGLCALHPGPCLEQMFLFHYLRSRQQSLSGEGTGTTFTAISKGVIENYPVPVAPLVEQRAIVSKIDALFSELDKGIEQLQTIKQQLKQYRKAVLKAAFEGELTAAWRAEQQAAGTLTSADDLLERIEKEREARYQQRLDEWKQAVAEWEAACGSGSDGIKPTRPSKSVDLRALAADELADLATLPKGWAWLAMPWLVSFDRKPMTTGPFGTLLKKRDHRTEGVPVLGIENIGEGLFVPGNKIFVSEAKASDLSSFGAEAGDIIISRSGTVGEICRVPEGLGRVLISSNLMRVSLNAAALIPELFVLAFQPGSPVKRQVEDLCKGSTRAFLNQTILNSLRFPVPGPREQRQVLQEIESRFSVFDELEKAVDYATNRAEALRRSILRKAFEGRLLSEAESTDVRNDPEYEPADKLLERIRAAGGTGKQPSRPDRARKRAHPMRPSCPRGNACLGWE